jgi:hypothetical protein
MFPDTFYPKLSCIPNYCFKDAYEAGLGVLQAISWSVSLLCSVQRYRLPEAVSSFVSAI